jgi:hypothetical protein
MPLDKKKKKKKKKGKGVKLVEYRSLGFSQNLRGRQVGR